MSLLQDVDIYLELKNTLGYKYRHQARVLRSYAAYAQLHGDEFLCAERMIDWVAETSSVGYAREKFAMLRGFALWMHAEHSCHEVPPPHVFGKRSRNRRRVHLFMNEELEKLLAASLTLEPIDSLRPYTLYCIIGLIAATGMRRSEALSLCYSDLRFDESAILIRDSKFCKSRLIPVHDSVVDAIERYLARRRRVAHSYNHVFVDANHLPLRPLQLWRYFCKIVIRSGIVAANSPPFPTIHGFRHTFAVRYLEAHVQPCSTGIPPELVALATYLGHASISDTYWYLQATPAILEKMADQAELFLFNPEDI